MSAAGARPFLVGVALAGGDVEQRDAGVVFANLREDQVAITFSDRLIVEYHEPHVCLRKGLAALAQVGSMANQPPRLLDDSSYEARQFGVVREEQQDWRGANVFEVRFPI